MISSAIAKIVDFCVRHRWKTILVGGLLAIGAAVLDIALFSINADIEALISQDLPWHRRQVQFNEAFPQQAITVVVRAPTSENAVIATDQLADQLRKDPNLFRSIVQPDGGAYFERNGLIFSSPADVRRTIAGLIGSRPLLSSLAADPSLRGVMRTLSSAARLVQSGTVKLDQLTWPLSLAEDTLKDVLADRPAYFSWQELLEGHPVPKARLRHFIEVAPKLNFDALLPGHAATTAIHHAAASKDLGDGLGATVQLTGPVPMNDDQFSVIRDSAVRETLLALLGFVIVLWLALRSWKVIAAVLFSLLVGLAATAALGLITVGSFNLISIAFFVLFVVLGVDFGIQFSVRYRAASHRCRGQLLRVRQDNSQRLR